MLKGLGDIGQLMKLQREFKNTQKKIAKMQAEGQSSNGQVTAKINGEYNLLDINLDDSLLESKDNKLINKSVMEAVNSAVKNIKDLSASEMGKLTGGIDVPGLGNMFK